MLTVDYTKRRRVMQRSQQLGHCICDPRRPCPCDIFTQQGYCPCAGERPAPASGADIRLTALVHNAGCASKISPRDLETVLSRLPSVDDPAVICGIPTGDDAGIYQLTDDLYLVQTVDVMTPCVDDPYTFGKICAANCLSDVYAMGGIPRTALSILAFPAETMEGEVMYQMLRGAMDIFAEAHVALLGGHSIKDDEIKLGFAITGTVAKDKIVERGTARVGDLLVLTKPLGSGVLSFARQLGRDIGDWDAAVAAMATLNRAAAEAAGEVAVSACTDVTGFGLFGHLLGMVTHSGVMATLYANQLPAFSGCLDALRAGIVSGAIERNSEYVGDRLSVAADVDEAFVHLGFDAQTSGGLLIAVPAPRHQALLQALARQGVSGYTIGDIREESSGRITLMASSEHEKPLPVASGAAEHLAAPCCAGSRATEASAETAVESARAFAALMRATSADGALDARTKELITFALVVHSRCAPCLRTHIEKAHNMGISDTELEEAVWCAVAMGGAPVRMFYLEAMKAYQEQEQAPHACCCR
jgi:selenide,water dikinase